MQDWNLNSDMSLNNNDNINTGMAMPFNDIIILDADLENPENNAGLC